MTTAREWRPSYPITFAPLFDPAAWTVPNFQKYFFGFPGFFAPWNIIYFALTCASHYYTTPALEACMTFAVGWLAQLFLRNMVLLWLFAGGWHALLYWPFQVQGLKKKYEQRFPDPAPKVGANKWIFGSQTAENIFVSCSSGVLTWTAYEALFLRLWSVGAIPGAYFDWWEKPAWSVTQLLMIPIWREVHFYFTHRAMHWKPLYKHVHYLHHKNVNPGPWSGLSMHPVEHILYFSVLIPHLWLAGHPLHFFFNAQHTALTPASGHHGFEGPIAGELVPTGSYFHYLHHRYL